MSRVLDFLRKVWGMIKRGTAYLIVRYVPSVVTWLQKLRDKEQEKQ